MANDVTRRGGVRIVRARDERLRDVKPLWRALVLESGRVGAAIGPALDVETSWQRARETHHDARRARRVHAAG